MDQIISGNNIIKINRPGRTWVTNSKLRKYLMSDDSVSMSIFSVVPLPIKINDTIDLYGKTYRVNNPPTFTKNNDNEYTYEVVFQGKMYDLQRCRMRNADAVGFSNKDDFPITGPIETHLLCIKNNMLRFNPNWQIGNFENGETKTISYSKEHCLSALQKICQEFNVEFVVDEVAGISIINTGNFGRTLDFTLEYGKGKGLYSIARTNVNENDVINRLYVEGGTQNLPFGYRNYSLNLQLPNETGYIEDVASIAKIGLKEGSAEFPDIYPSRTGTITSLGDSILSFLDTSMDFDLNEKKEDGSTKYLQPGEAAKVHFKTGNLAGFTFDLKEGGYNHTTKTFTINAYNDEQINQVYPSAETTAFQFNVGDEYTLLDIYMPQTYVDNKENTLLDRGTEQFSKLKSPKVNYKVNTDPKFWKKIALSVEEHPFNVGDKIPMKDEKLQIDSSIKIVGFTRDLLATDHSYEIDIADDYAINFQASTILTISGIKSEISSQKTVIKEGILTSVKRINELKDLIFDPTGNELTPRIETMLMSVGGVSQQYQLQDVTISINVGDDANKVNISAGELIHYGLSDTDLEWNFVNLSTENLDADKVYYLYAKCQKSGVQGEWILSTEKIIYDSVPNDYYFLVGVLHKVKNNVRSYSPLDGFSIFNGRYITTGRVAGFDDKTALDLDQSLLDLDNEAGMSGKGPLSEIFFWSNGGYANRANANVWMKKNGHFRFKTQAGLEFDSETNKIVGRYSNGQIGMQMTMENGYPELAFFKEDGTKVYALGQGGIYYVTEIPESWTQTGLFKLNNSNVDEDDSNLMAIVRGSLCGIGDPPDINQPGQFSEYRLNQNQNSYLYDAGQNLYSEDRKKHNGYKSTNGSYVLNVDDGWYSLSYPNMLRMGTGEIIIKVFYLANGRIQYPELQERVILLDPTTWNFTQCII